MGLAERSNYPPHKGHYRITDQGKDAVAVLKGGA
jgi:DNA-binding HxlR family transcriptional regulator